MMPYPASGDDAVRAAKIHEDSVTVVLGLTKSAALGAPSQETLPNRAGSRAEDMPPVWKRYIDSRLKQFCTR